MLLLAVTPEHWAVTDLAAAFQLAARSVTVTALDLAAFCSTAASAALKASSVPV